MFNMVYDGSTPGVLTRLLLCNELSPIHWSSITKKGTLSAERCGREISISK
jgi:hypothetical protein